MLKGYMVRERMGTPGLGGQTFPSETHLKEFTNHSLSENDLKH